MTPIAQNYLNTVSGQPDALTCKLNDGEYSPLGEVIGFGEIGVFPKTFNVSIPEVTLNYVAVAPVDGYGTQGERSNISNTT